MTYKQQLENRRLVQQQKEAQQAREMEQQRNKIEDRKKQLQKHLEDNCRPKSCYVLFLTRTYCYPDRHEWFRRAQGNLAVSIS